MPTEAGIRGKPLSLCLSPSLYIMYVKKGGRRKGARKQMRKEEREEGGREGERGKEGRLVYSGSVQGTVNHSGKAGRQGCGAVGHIALYSGNRGRWMLVLSWICSAYGMLLLTFWVDLSTSVA